MIRHRPKEIGRSGPVEYLEWGAMQEMEGPQGRRLSKTRGLRFTTTAVSEKPNPLGTAGAHRGDHISDV